MIPKPSMLMKMTAISDSAAREGGAASRGGVSDMVRQLRDQAPSGKARGVGISGYRVSVGERPHRSAVICDCQRDGDSGRAGSRALRVLPLQLRAERRLGLLVEGLAP